MPYRIDAIRDKFYNLKWYEVYDFIEFIKREFAIDRNCISELNKIFEEEKAPYRIIGDFITPLTSELEIKEIKQVLGVSDKYQPIRNHINKALEFYSKKPKPDFQNSIKESISAIEALGRLLTTEKGKVLSRLVGQLPIHSALKIALEKLYSWTSDEGGIRHSETGERLISGEEEARFMLVICSAFVNYILGKYEIKSLKQKKFDIQNIK